MYHRNNAFVNSNHYACVQFHVGVYEPAVVEVEFRPRHEGKEKEILGGHRNIGDKIGKD